MLTHHLSLEQYLTYAKEQLRSFELLSLRRQNIGLLDRDMSLRHWEEEFSMFLARTQVERPG